jgi:hypothetical protein
MSDEHKKLMGSMTVHKGHKLFRYNTSTTELAVCTDYETDEYGRRKVTMENDCLYILALNERNAIRKLKNLAK